MPSGKSKTRAVQGPLRRRANAICKRLRPWLGAEDHPAVRHPGSHGFWHALPHLLLSALFIASLVHLLPGLTLPLELPARLVVSNVAAHWLTEYGAGKYPEDDDFALLKIDSKTFRDMDRYGGRSPLDRCKLKDDLGAVLRQLPTLQSLGIDFDLSPTGDPAQDCCAGEILAILRDKAAATPGFVSTVILPIDPDERRTLMPWRQQVVDHKVRLADPELDLQFGMVRQHRDDGLGCPSLGLALGLQQPKGERQALCVQDPPEAKADNSKRYNVAFHRLALLKHQPQMVSAKEVETFDRQLAALKGQGVTRLLFGPGYEHSDEFLTPLGLLNGVDVHAAIALEPHERHNKWVDFVIDVVLGVLFGALVHRIWSRYFDQRLDRLRRSGQPRLAYKWLLLLGLLLAAAILVVLPGASTWVTVVFGWWISPVPMLVGMTVDALVTGSVKASIGRHEQLVAAGSLAEPPQASAPDATFYPGILQVVGLHLPALFWLLVVGWALVGLVTGKAH